MANSIKLWISLSLGLGLLWLVVAFFGSPIESSETLQEFERLNLDNANTLLRYGETDLAERNLIASLKDNQLPEKYKNEIQYIKQKIIVQREADWETILQFTRDIMDYKYPKDSLNVEDIMLIVNEIDRWSHLYFLFKENVASINQEAIDTMESKLISLQLEAFPMLRKELKRNWVEKYVGNNIEIRMSKNERRLAFVSTDFENNYGRINTLMENDYYFSFLEDLRFEKIMFFSLLTKEKKIVEEFKLYKNIKDDKIQARKGV